MGTGQKKLPWGYLGHSLWSPAPPSMCIPTACHIYHKIYALCSSAEFADTPGKPLLSFSEVYKFPSEAVVEIDVDYLALCLTLLPPRFLGVEYSSQQQQQ